MAKPVIVVEIPAKVEDQYLVLMDGEDLNKLIEVADINLWTKEKLVPLEDYASVVRTAKDKKRDNNLSTLPEKSWEDLENFLSD